MWTSAPVRVSAVLRARAAGGAQEAKVADDRLFLYRPRHRWPVSLRLRHPHRGGKARRQCVRGRARRTTRRTGCSGAITSSFLVSRLRFLDSVAGWSLLHHLHDQRQ